MPLEQILLYVVFGLAPGIFWVWFFYRKDNIQPEPKKLIVTIFLWGMVATVPALFVESGLIYFIPIADFTSSLGLIAISAFVIIAPAEEIFKYLVTRRFIRYNIYFDEALDGVIYAVTAGLGFASAENILVVFNGGTADIIWRSVTATLLHALASGALGYFIGLGKLNPAKMKLRICQGLIIAIALHGFYDFIASIDFPLRLASLIALNIIAYTFLGLGMHQLKKADQANIKVRNNAGLGHFDDFQQPPSVENR